jgi:hypothetical protein
MTALTAMPRARSVQQKASKTPRPREQVIKKSIAQALNFIQGVFVWPNNVGAYKKDDWFGRYGLAVGSADLIGIAGGRFFALEVKRDSKSKARHSQALWLNEVIRLGGFAAVVSSVQQAMQAAHDAKLGKKASQIPVPPPPKPRKKRKVIP